MHEPATVVLFILAGAILAWGAYKLVERIETSSQNTKISPLTTLQETLDQAPLAIWAERDQQVIWQNAACQLLFQNATQRGIAAFEPVEPAKDDKRMRLLSESGGDSLEYTVEQVAIGDSQVYYANNIAPLVEAEQELSRFIQTLTGTFAHLPIGLVVFDKQRDLSLFNPALSDLLNLPAEWLIRRPSLMAFLDRLRYEGIMPEPADFNSLRQEFLNMEGGISKGDYSAEWTLASGQIYRVTGRPHIHGGLALLFEDISKSVMIERRYRGELEKLYSAFDSLADAVAIFDPAGELVFVNDAFDDLWQCDLANALVPVTVIDFTRMLQKNTAPTPIWGDFREFVLDAQNRSQWQSEIIKTDGYKVLATFSPIAGGQIFCEFKTIETDVSPIIPNLSSCTGNT